MGESYSVMRQMINQVKGKGKRIVFPEGDKEAVLRAAAQLVDQNICHPVLLGPVERIDKMVEDLRLSEYEAYDPRYDERRKTEYANAFLPATATKRNHVGRRGTPAQKSTVLRRSNGSFRGCRRVCWGRQSELRRC